MTTSMGYGRRFTHTAQLKALKQRSRLPSRTVSTSRELVMNNLKTMQAELNALETQITNMETTIKDLRAAKLRSDLHASVLLEGIRSIVRKSRRGGATEQR
jgi:hypothetical protein